MKRDLCIRSCSSNSLSTSFHILCPFLLFFGVLLFLEHQTLRNFFLDVNLDLDVDLELDVDFDGFFLLLSLHSLLSSWVISKGKLNSRLPEEWVIQQRKNRTQTTYVWYLSRIQDLN